MSLIDLVVLRICPEKWGVFVPVQEDLSGVFKKSHHVPAFDAGVLSFVS